jgi:hypothetical protein
MPDVHAIVFNLSYILALMRPRKLWTDSKSQSFQESFVLNATNEKSGGFYIEVGSNHPNAFSTTYLLESRFDWKGLGLEISKRLVDEYNYVRKNLAICADATSIDYLSLFKEHGCPQQMDYLQLDIEPSIQTLLALKAIPFEKYAFSVITFEHDLYTDSKNVEIQNEAFLILRRFGYKRLIKGVSSKGNNYEDWYVHPDLIDDDFIQAWNSTKEQVDDTELFSNSMLV